MRWLALVVLVGCATHVAVPVAFLPQLVEGEAITVDNKGTPLTLKAGQDPPFTLALDVADRKWPVKLDRIERRQVGDDLAVAAPDGTMVPLANVTAAEAAISGRLPLGWTPTLGFGVGGLGAGLAGLVGFRAAVFATEWLVFEGGIDLGYAVLITSAGFRLRPFALGPLRPLIGAFISSATENDNPFFGPRVGLDLEVPRHTLLTAEVDPICTPYAHRPDFPSQKGCANPWPGFAATWMF
jgi:hypothetical protein